jgi:hypothetical protein
MAWVRESNYEKWDQNIAGVEWLINRERSPLEYCFFIREQSALPTGLGDLSLIEGDDHTAEYWRASYAALWSDELAPDQPAVAHNGSAQAGDAEDEDEDEDDAASEDQSAVVTAIRLTDPTVTSSGPPEYAPQGAFAWTAGFSAIEPQAVRSWVIQRVQVIDNGAAKTFYEAFAFLPNAANATDEDVYQNNARTVSGEFNVLGAARHYVFTNGAAPPGFTPGGSGLADREQWSTDRAMTGRPTT